MMSHSDSDLENRAARIIADWASGKRPDTVAVLQANPDFNADKGVVLDLAFAEFILREKNGEKIDIEAYCKQFPQYYASLARMLLQQSLRDPIGADAGSGDNKRDPKSDPEDPNHTVNVQVQPVSSSGAEADRPYPAPLTHDGHTPRSGDGTGSGSGSGRFPRNNTWPEAGERVGGFNLVRAMGRGAFGRVFLAMEESVNRHVVVKLTRQKCDEAKVLGKLGHRNVVSVLSAPHDHATGFYIVVMPYLGSATVEDLIEVAYPGGDLNAKPPESASVILTAARRNVHPNDPLPASSRPESFLQRASYVDGTVWLGIRIAEALAAVHQVGFLHHDLKPSNILLELDGQPRLLDFNLASDARQTKSRLGGTLPYMPPEHLKSIESMTGDRDQRAGMDHRGDIYSLGVILYELACGKHPFGRFLKARSIRSVAHEILGAQKIGTRPARDRNPSIPLRMSRLIDRCLSFDVSHRPNSAQDVADELRRCYSTKKRMLEFAGSRGGRTVVTASIAGLVSGIAWVASAEAARTVPPTPDNHRELGLTALRQGRYVDAGLHLGKAAEEDPNDGAVRLARARSFIAQGQLSAARRDARAAMDLRPDHGPTIATYAWCCAQQSQHSDAIAAVQQARRAGFDTAAVHAVAAFCYSQQRKFDEALAAVDEALKRDPKCAAALGTRAYIAHLKSVESMKPMPVEALDDLRVAVSAGTDPQAHAFAAHAYAMSAHWLFQRKGKTDPDAIIFREQCRTAIRKAVELGLPVGYWRESTTISRVLGEPDSYSQDWRFPKKEASFQHYWRTGIPLTDFAG